MAPEKQRAIKVDQRSQMAAMQALEAKTDEELERETRFKSAAQTILGARAAERYDAKAARAHFQKALTAARPQERLQIRRIADASLALAERRAGDLKVASERLGVEAPSGRQLFMLRMLGLIAPPSSAGLLPRLRGILIVLILIAAILVIAFGLVTLIALPFGGLSLDLRIFYGIALLFVAFGVLFFFGRRRQRAANVKRAEDIAARSSR